MAEKKRQGNQKENMKVDESFSHIGFTALFHRNRCSTVTTKELGKTGLQRKQGV